MKQLILKKKTLVGPSKGVKSYFSTNKGVNGSPFKFPTKLLNIRHHIVLLKGKSRLIGVFYA